MALSKRERILANWLTTMQTITGLNATRLALPFTPQSENKLLVILSGGEVPNETGDHMPLRSRILTILNVLYFRTGSETEVNALLQQIYAAGMADQHRGGLAEQTEWLNHSEVDIAEDGNQAQITSAYGIHYFHDPFDESLP